MALPAEFSPSSEGLDHVMFMAHDAHLIAQSEIWEELAEEVCAGRMSEEEAHLAYDYWNETHPDLGSL